MQPPIAVIRRFLPFILLSSLFFQGCIQKIALSSMSGIMDNGFVVINEERDLGIADVSIASDLKLLEAVLRSDPDNEHLLLLASIGYSSYALGFVEDDSAARASTLYLRGMEFGLRILRHHQAFANAENADLESFTKALGTLSKDEVPAVFWTAVGRGSSMYLNLNDPSVLAELPKIEAMMNFVLAKDPNYYYGGAHFFLGTLYGSSPKALGGRPDISRKHFEDCLAINGGKYLIAYYYYARSYAVQVQDQELFTRLLTTVDTTSIDVLPEARLSNVIAKRKAKLLMAKVNDLF